MVSPARRERKVISVVFSDLVGFTGRSETLDPEDVEAFLRPYHERLRRDLERFGGTVEKFIGDAVVAIFGAPITHEDDAERAVRAALAIRDGIREAGDLEVRIAVNTGVAIVNLDAAPDAGEGIATGDVVNTAARLQAAAPVNEIIVGEATYSATRDAIRYEPADPVVAKGKAEPISVWRAVEARSRFGVDVSQAARLPLVGRERERSILLDTLARVESERTPQLVTLLGVPGIGKSRLVWELFSELERETDLRYWRQGRCLPYGQGVSLWALAEMIKAQAGVLEGDDDEAVRAKLASAVREVVPEEEADWVSASLRPLVGLEAQADTGGAAGASRDEAFTAWRRFFESLAERYPLVLVFEDIHWADDTLLDFIDHLVDWARDVPILVLCTARPELLERRPGWGGGKSNALTLRLTALSDADSAQLLSNALGTPVVAAETQQLLLERASGNPLYAEQFARLLVDRGSAQDLPLPESVQGLIAARLDTLSIAEKALLQDASVMGKVFWSGALAGDDDRGGLLHALDRKEFIRRERRSSVLGQDEYAFRHVLVRDVAYDQIPKADRATKHLRAAEWIDSLGRPQDHAELVAHHYRSAMQLNPAPLPAHLVDRARTALQDAGDRSFALGSFAGAVGYYRAALERMEADDPNRPTALFGLGRAQYRATGGGADILAAAADALVAVGDPETAAEAESLLTTLWWESGKRELWLPHLARAAELVSDAPITSSKAQVFATRARHLYLSGDFRTALPIATEALEMAASVGREDLRAHALNTIGMSRWETDAEAGYAAMRESIAISNTINSADAFKGYNNLQVMLEVDGHPREAMDAWRDSIRVAERFGAQGDLRWARYSGVWWAFFTGDWDRALEEIDGFVREAEEGSAHYMIGGQFLHRARIRVARDDLPGAVRDSSVALAHARRAMDPQNLIPALAHELWIRVELGDSKAAGATLEEMLGGRTLGAANGFSSVGSTVAWAVASLGRGREWLNVISSWRRTLWTDAASLIIGGDWLAAAEKYVEIGSPIDEAFARLHAAEQLSAFGRRAEADQQLELSLAFFRKVRATRYVAKAEALLSAIA